MIHFTTTEIYFLAGYSLIFVFLLGLLVHATNDFPQKARIEILIYSISILGILAIFNIGAWLTLKLSHHYESSAFILVTMIYSPESTQYEVIDTKKVTDHQAALLAAHFETCNMPVRTEFYNKAMMLANCYQYNLINDIGGLQNCFSNTYFLPMLLQADQHSLISNTQNQVQ